MSISSLRRFASLLAASSLMISTLAACSSAGDVVDTATDAVDDAASSVTAGGTCAADIKEIEFGIISTESADNLKPQWEPLLADMSEAVGRPVKGFYATDYAGVIEGMGAGKVQVAWYGGKSYIEAAERSEAEAFVQTVALDGSKGYYSHLITNKENPIVGEIDLEKGNGDKYVVENAADLTFAFNDPNSTSGFLVPTYYVFAQQGANADKIFSELIFAGSHEATALAVSENQVDIATNNNENLARLEETAPDALEKIQIIWTSPVIPSDPLAYRKDLPDCLKDSIKDFFIGYDNTEVLEGLQWTGLDEAKDSDWNTIRELQIAKDLLEVQNDENLSDGDKQTKLDELNKKLDALK
ncbi:phosphonate ABC transporter substrate-binding protein [Leptothoe spongobia]|uniref:Phosphonate ABC transporter substrate-binding protein n=1 Tax=Leptothoe spongobia TAU-MAC 1115 TaxID=1967444 RepID=A0A947DF23_9CYAN|nr:phosphonate ABC transporter substrate-binding protein [Leptothoe spongobia]MBT9314721.1 phosphonate ABC transporter substrate-binding protein [Leptothoe spongobia TAU-MAC 1115]